MSSLVEANNGLSADALSAAARMRTEAFRVFILVGAERFWLRGPGRPPRPADCGVWREPLPSPLTTDSPARYHRRSEEHTSELQSLRHLVCRLLLEKKNR